MKKYRLLQITGVFFILFFVVYFFYSKKYNIPIKQIQKIKLKENKSEVINLINQYKFDKILTQNQTLKINNIVAYINFLYCNDCFGGKLEGITLTSNNQEELFRFIKKRKIEEKLFLKMYEIRNSANSLDTIICIHTNKIKLFREFGVINCRRLDTEPCWKLY